jgi:hypothetical protein
MTGVGESGTQDLTQDDPPVIAAYLKSPRAAVATKAFLPGKLQPTGALLRAAPIPP